MANFEEILSQNVEWEEAMAFAEETVSKAIANRSFGFIVNKRDNMSVAFNLKPPKRSLTEAMGVMYLFSGEIAVKKPKKMDEETKSSAAIADISCADLKNSIEGAF